MSNEEIFNRMMKMEGGELSLTVNRTPTAQDRDGLSASLSPEAFDVLMTQIKTWVGTRMVRYGQETGLMPQNVNVSVDVTVSA